MAASPFRVFKDRTAYRRAAIAGKTLRNQSIIAGIPVLRLFARRIAMSMPLDGVAETSKPTRRDLDAAASATALAKRLGLRHVSSTALTIRRRPQGKGWIYLNADGRRIRDPATIKRLARLAVPPAYRDVLYAEDASAHLQAVGRDDAGRLQYRYHPEWEKVREIRKA